MKGKKKLVKYPQNLPLKAEIDKAGLSISQMAKRIGCSRETLSLTVNGHYLGTNIVPRLREELSK
jgi:hypothetical protein